MISLLPVVKTELRKAIRSPMFWITVIGIAVMPLMLGLLMFVKKYPALAQSGLMLSKATMIPGNADWPAYFSFFAQMISGAGLVVYGFVASWLFGREYSDRTIKDLLALPLPRGAIVLGKFAVMGGWCGLLLVIASAVMLASGFALRLDGWSFHYCLRCLAVFGIAALMNAGLCMLTAFVACWTRGYLAAIGFVIVTLILGNFVGMLGLGPYYPWAIPLLYATKEAAGGSLEISSIMIVIFISIAGLCATLAWWRFADQT